jgi:hypothetical protein
MKKNLPEIFGNAASFFNLKLRYKCSW